MEESVQSSPSCPFDIVHLNEPSSLRFKGAIFDLDGVVTQTSHLHFRSWKLTFDEFLKQNSSTTQIQEFSQEDYLKHVDGRPRVAGVQEFLKSRNISVEEGSQSDPITANTIWGIGKKKNEIFNQLLQSEGVIVYSKTIRLIEKLRKKNIPIGVASSSKNCSLIVRKSNIEHLFNARIDGEISEALKLRGKPEPDIFVKCCSLLNLFPRDCILFEDSTAGVEAARRGNFGLVIGINRGQNRLNLINAGAHIVIEDEGDFNLWRLNDNFLDTSSTWTLHFNSFDKAKQHLREALCTLGNGYMASRGSLEEAIFRRAKSSHYPGTYLIGIYDRSVSSVNNMEVENEDLVNFPNWTNIFFRYDSNSDWLCWEGDSIQNHETIEFKQLLNMKEGVLTRRCRIRSLDGKITTITVNKIVHMRKYHLASLKYSFCAENWSGTIEFLSSIDGSVENFGVARYQSLNSQHLDIKSAGFFDIIGEEKGFYFVLQTKHSGIEATIAARTICFIEGKKSKVLSVSDWREERKIGRQVSLQIQEGTVVDLEKCVAIYTIRDKGIYSTLEAAKQAIQRVSSKRFLHLMYLHTLHWEEIWERCDMNVQLSQLHSSFPSKQFVLHEKPPNVFKVPELTSAYEVTPRIPALRSVSPLPFLSYSLEKDETEGEFVSRILKQQSEDQLIHEKLLSEYEKLVSEKKDCQSIIQSYLQHILRFHIFHLITTVSQNSIALDISAPARGIHGEAYRGHVFWDEIFVIPFYMIRFPEIVESMLLYRYFRLDSARDNAKKYGCYGACFPWQSASSGREETQIIHFNPISKAWDPDYSSLQLHVNLAIAYNIWRYYSHSGNILFMDQYGTEMILEISRFCAMKCIWNDQTGRYDINEVMGPDEYHEKFDYGNNWKHGLRNNSYTNIMVVWCLEKALYLIKISSQKRRNELFVRLHLFEEELSEWREITKKMTIPFHDGCIISQFEGYETLKELDWEKYRTKYGNIRRMDRILKAEGDSPDHYKVSKQADVCMIFYLLNYQECQALFQQLGYSFNREIALKNIRYYFDRTSHGSTLSLVVFSQILYDFDPEESWKLYCEFILSDICDTQQGTTQEGIHVVPMAASINMVVSKFCGIDTSSNVIHFNPNLPQAIESISFRFQFQHEWISVELNHSTLQISSDQNVQRPLPILVKGEFNWFLPGTTLTFRLDHCKPLTSFGNPIQFSSYPATPLIQGGESILPSSSPLVQGGESVLPSSQPPKNFPISSINFPSS